MGPPSPTRSSSPRNLGPNGRPGQALRLARRPAPARTQPRRARGRKGDQADRARRGAWARGRCGGDRQRPGRRHRSRRNPPGRIRGGRVPGARGALVARRGRAPATGAAIDPVVLVHDGARPLVTRPRLCGRRRRGDARRGHPRRPGRGHPEAHRGRSQSESTVDRSDLAAAQTPQGARASLLRRAFAAFPADGPARFTDEAALLEACTIPVHPIPGDPLNLKVTVPADLSAPRPSSAAPRRAASASARIRTRSGPGEPLRLGGMEIPGAPRLHGHSDGDVALHAISDALLVRRLLEISAGCFRRTAERRADCQFGAARGSRASPRADGWRPSSVDLTIVGARPRLAATLGPMRVVIADPRDQCRGGGRESLNGKPRRGRGRRTRAVRDGDRNHRADLGRPA